MARIDDFILARDLSRRELAEKDINSVAIYSGAVLNINSEDNSKSLLISFLNRDVIVSWPEMGFSHNDSGDEVPIQQQVLLLHYMNGVCNYGAQGGSGEWVSFQDLPDGRFYMGAFLKRAKEPLVRTFGLNPAKMVEAAAKIYNATPMEYGDFSVVIKALPMVSVVLVLWQGDDEFPAEGNILFDRGITGILSAEDIAWLAGAVVYPLVAMAGIK
jgi:hypothetical protein